MTQEEIYASIKGFENYQVSNLGNVKNIKTNKILKPYFDGGGYYTIDLCKNKRRHVKKIHKLVIQSFLENIDSKACVDHINGKREDNNIKNLRYATFEENNRNRKIAKNNASSVKGVNFDKDKNKWRARITIDGIRIHLGYFDTIEEAKLSRIKKVHEVFGEFINECEKE